MGKCMIPLLLVILTFTKPKSDKSTSYVKVDLNDYFNPEEADWNRTELSDDEWEYLRSKNVFIVIPLYRIIN